MKKRILTRIFSFVLAFAMVVSSAEISAFASDVNDVSGNDKTEIITEIEDVSSGEIIDGETPDDGNDEAVPSEDEGQDETVPSDETITDPEEENIPDEIIEEDPQDVSENEQYDAPTNYYKGKISVKIGSEKAKTYVNDEIAQGIDAASNATKPATVTLLSNISVMSYQNLWLSGNKITLSLGKYNITGNVPYYDSGIIGLYECDLTITGSGSIINTASTATKGCTVYVGTDSGLTLKGGKLISNYCGINGCTSGSGYGINIVGGEINVKSDGVDDSKSVYGIIIDSEEMYLYVTGGKINVSGKSAIGINAERGAVVMTSGSVNVSSEKPGSGLTGVLTKKNPFTMKGGNINVTASKGESTLYGVRIEDTNHTGYYTENCQVSSDILGGTISVKGFDGTDEYGYLFGISTDLLCGLNISNTKIKVYGGAYIAEGIGGSTSSTVYASNNTIEVIVTGDGYSEDIYGCYFGAYSKVEKTKITVKSGVNADGTGIYSTSAVTVRNSTISVDAGNIADGVVSTMNTEIRCSSITVKGNNSTGVLQMHISSGEMYQLNPAYIYGTKIAVTANKADYSSACGVAYGLNEDYEKVTGSRLEVVCSTINVRKQGTSVGNKDTIGINIFGSGSPYIAGSIINVSNDYYGDVYGIKSKAVNGSYFQVSDSTVNVSNNIEMENGEFCRFNMYGINVENKDVIGIRGTKVNVNAKMDTYGQEIKGIVLKNTAGASAGPAQIDNCSVNVTNKATHHGYDKDTISGGIFVDGYVYALINGVFVKCVNDCTGETGFEGIYSEPIENFVLTDSKVYVEAKNFEGLGIKAVSGGVCVGGNCNKTLSNSEITLIGSGFGLGLFGDEDSVKPTLVTIKDTKIKAQLTKDYQNDKNASKGFYGGYDKGIVLDNVAISSTDAQIDYASKPNEIEITNGTSFESLSGNIGIHFYEENPILPISNLSCFVDKSGNIIDDIYSVKYAKLKLNIDSKAVLSDKRAITNDDQVIATLSLNQKPANDTNVQSVTWYMNGNEVTDTDAFSTFTLNVKKAAADTGAGYSSSCKIKWKAVIKYGDTTDVIVAEKTYYYNPQITLKAINGTLNGKFEDGSSTKLIGVDYRGTLCIPEPIAPEGYVFACWQVGGEDVDIKYYSATSDETFTAKYVPEGLYIVRDWAIVSTYDDGAVVLPDKEYDEGKPQTYDFSVKYGNAYLVEGTDFTVTYSNNKNVGTKKNPYAWITVKGKGKYKGTIKIKFKITPNNIYSVGGYIRPTYKYTGKAITPEVNLTTASKKALKKGTDYKLYYTDVADKRYTSISKKGNYVLHIEGINNYCDEATVSIAIVDVPSIKKCNIYLDTTYDADTYFAEYISKGKKPEPKIIYNGDILEKGTDYTLEYQNADDAGTATLIIRGIVNYCEKTTITYKIVGTSISSKNISFAWNVGSSSKTYYYQDKGIPGFKLYDTKKGEYLIDGTDYEKVWSGPLNTDETLEKAGKYTVTIKGKGKYSGSIKKTFTINKFDFAKAYKITGPVYTKDKLTVNTSDDTNFQLNTAGVTPRATMYIGNGTTKDIVSTNDYTVKYTNNNKVGKAYIVITGKGNCKGTVKVPFTIYKSNINNNAFGIYVTGAKAGAAVSTSKIVVKQSDEKVDLKSGKDYTVSYRNSRGEDIKSTYKVKDGEVITAVITGKGNFVGTKTCNFVVSKKTLANVKISIATQTDLYSLSQKDITVKDGTKKLTYGVDFIIDEYVYKSGSDDSKCGVIIEGIGNYSGRKVVLYSISPKKFSLAKLFN